MCYTAWPRKEAPCNIAYTDVFVGIAAVRYTISFDRGYRNVVLECQGALYEAGVDPFDDGSEPIPMSEFECGQIPLGRVPK